MAVIFSPTFPERLVHMVLAAYLATALVVGAASAFVLLKDETQAESRVALRMAIAMFAVVAPLQLVVGDYAGKHVRLDQPSKLAAIEAFWDTKSGESFDIIAWPDRKIAGNRFAISIPRLGSLITAGNERATIIGLKAFAPRDRPPVFIVFWAFRVMAGLGLAMIGLGLWGAFLWWRGGPERSRLFLRAATLMGPTGFVAVIAGWTVAEVGRQPWVIWHVMRTAVGVSPIGARQVSASLLGFLIVYAVIFAAGALFILRLIAVGPAPETAAPSDAARAPLGRPWRPPRWSPEMTGLDLPLIACAVIAAAVLFYVLLDGFDLGVGILFPLARSTADRDTMMASIAPYWDGNETWLVLGGAGLFAAFPGAYAIVMPAFYLPVMGMLMSLILRGVAFEFRLHGRRRGKSLWSFAFGFGSLVAALAQGLILGGFVQGVRVAHGAFAGGPFDWATPYSLLVGVGLVAGYALLGAGWLMVKTRDDLHGDARRWTRNAALAVAVLLAAVSVATLMVHPGVAARWGVGGAVDLARLIPRLPIPALGAAGLALAIAGVRGRSHRLPFVGALIVFLSGYLGLAASFFPNIVPYQITFRAAANADNALGLLLIGFGVMLPVILGYTAFVYWVFRGKVAADAGHH